MLFRRPVASAAARFVPRALFHSSPPYSALKRFKLADIGEGITEVEVIKWNVKPFSPVHTFDPLCEVQSDKASVEITSPYDGIVKDVFVEEGQVANVGSDLCTIEVADDPLAPTDASDFAQESSRPAPEPQDPSYSAHEFQPSEQFKSLAPTRKPHPLDPNVSQEARAGTSSAQDVLATPSVRHYAREHGVDLSKITPGSGKDGRIERRDVDAFLTGNVSQSTSHHEAPPRGGTQEGQDITVELSRTRNNMWKAMEKSLSIPQFSCSSYLDITELHSLLPTLNAHIPKHYLPTSAYSADRQQVISPAYFHAPPAAPDVPSSGQYTRLTYLPLLLKSLSRAMLEWPLFRASIALSNQSSKATMTLRPHADISIALSTPTGLYTPTLRAVDTQSVYALAAQLKHISHLGRQVPCALTLQEMPKRGGTLSVSNVGGIGDVDSAAPVLVPGGGVAIVAIGRAKWVWDVNRGDGKGERRLKVGVSWSADHRVVEGAELVAFNEVWRGWVEAPQRLIADSI